MKTKVVLTAALVALGILAADKIQSMNAKLGLWEITMSQQMTGALPIPPETLAKMPAEQRARIEERFKQRAGAPSVTTRQVCMTEAKRNKAAFSEERQGCERTIVASTSQRIQVHEECTDKSGAHSSSDAKFDLSGDTAMKGSVRAKTMHGDSVTNINVDLTGKWLNADCGTVK